MHNGLCFVSSKSKCTMCNKPIKISVLILFCYIRHWLLWGIFGQRGSKPTCVRAIAAHERSVPEQHTHHEGEE